MQVFKIKKKVCFCSGLSGKINGCKKNVIEKKILKIVIISVFTAYLQLIDKEIEYR